MVVQPLTMERSHIDVIHPHEEHCAQCGRQHADDDTEALADEPPLLVELTSQRLRVSRHPIQLVGDVHRTKDQNITHDNVVDMKDTRLVYNRHILYH